jgi:DNA polymerase-3 subunit epsilon
MYAASWAVAGVTGGVLWAGLRAEERAALRALLAGHAPLAAAGALLALAVLWVLVEPVVRAWVSTPLELAEGVRIAATANPAHRVEPRGSRELQELARAINGLAERHEALLRELEQRVAEAQRRVEEEKNRLAALVRELAQSVIVCNVEGRILLYNDQAQRLFADQGGGAPALGGANPVGLGRSVFAILERGLITHALDAIEERLRRRDASPVASLVTTTAGGRLVRVRVAPVRGPAPPGGPEAAIAGFVLVADDVTRAVEEGSRSQLVLQSLVESSRGAVGTIRAAAETLLSYRDMDAARQIRFLEAIAQEATGMASRLEVSAASGGAPGGEWLLEDMLGADLVAAARTRLHASLGLRVATEADPSLWLRVDSYSLLLALGALARRLRDEHGVRELRLRLEAAGKFAHLDLSWSGATLPPDALSRWQAQLVAGRDAAPFTVQDVVARHGGELWHQVERGSPAGFFRLLLPAVRRQESAFRPRPVGGGRPEYYDFDLFHQAGQSAELDQRPLTELAYTVFDTETTGLEPSAGDEIFCIGALRILNGRLLHHEAFEQLVDPHRELSPESVRITGMDAALLQGQPPIERVLPAFHRFCADSVLVAHNAAFDLRFLQLKEERAGVRFTQPVLDTLLLSSVVQPNLGAAALEELADRFGVAVLGRHTALGDAIMTGEIFLKLLPLLAERGIVTLGQAREASERSLLARLRY